MPLLLEAHGLDVTPPMIVQLDRSGDPASAEILKIIYQEEVGHVAAGQRWFLWLCERQGAVPAATYRNLVQRYFKGAPKPPFNHQGRAAAGLEPSFYEWSPMGG